MLGIVSMSIPYRVLVPNLHGILRTGEWPLLRHRWLAKRHSHTEVRPILLFTPMLACVYSQYLSFSLIPQLLKMRSLSWNTIVHTMEDLRSSSAAVRSATSLRGRRMMNCIPGVTLPDADTSPLQRDTADTNA
jgi:hypothetical protein